MSILTTLELTRGTSRTITLTLALDGVAINISDWTVYFTVKRSHKDSDDDAIFQKTITNHPLAAQGIATIEILPEDTEELDVRIYDYDIKVVTDDAKPKAYAVARGKLNLEYNVTRSMPA